MDPDQLSSVVSSAVTRAITEATRLQPRDTPESPAVSQPPAIYTSTSGSDRFKASASNSSSPKVAIFLLFVMP